MEIIRNGEKIKLTPDEIFKAHREFVTGWMAGALIADFDIPPRKAEDLAYTAYDIYCTEEGISEYEAVEKAVEQYKNISNSHA